MEIQLQRSAYHEAGHILIGYLMGYKCDRVQLNVDAEGNANSLFNYDPDLYLITALTNYISNPGIFDGLDKAIKNRSINVGNRILHVLLAGSVSETLFLNDFKTGEYVELEIFGPDLLRSQEVHAFLTQWKKDHDANYVQTILSEQFQFYLISEFIDTLHKLAEEILAQKDYTLNRDQIEATLKQTNYLAYIEQFQ